MSNDPKQPKKLELTEPAPRKPEEGGEGASLPVSIELNQKRSQHNQNFENSLRQARIELIKSIQQKRGSKVFVFYSHDTLDAQHAEIFFELLQEVGNLVLTGDLTVEKDIEVIGYIDCAGYGSFHSHSAGRWGKNYAIVIKNYGGRL